MTDSRTLHETVIKNNYCIGCGACAAIENSPFKMVMDAYGNIVAKAEESELDKSDAKLLKVCPFSGVSKNEDELGNIYFPKNKMNDKHLGKYLNCYAGYVVDDTLRSIGSSGGIGKWLSKKLLDDNLVDYYVQVTPNKTNKAGKALFNYAIFSDSSEAIQGSTSAYYPTTLANVIDDIKNKPGRYAITGVPCFIKTLRLLAQNNPLLNERIKYTVGIVCGSMKSANQSKMIAWQLGMHPDNLTRIDFRGKNYGVTAATTKIYRVWSDKDNLVREKNSNEIFGADYGLGFFKPNACDYCDDVVAETADISIGDVWLPQYRFDTKGYSLIIVRNPELANLLKEWANKKLIHLDNISAEDAIRTQIGGFRHRRESLSYRIEIKETNGEWYPQKRVNAGDFTISKKRKKIYDIRLDGAQKSHEVFLEALNKDNFTLFHKEMSKSIKQYLIAYEGYLPKRLFMKVIRKIKRLLK